MSLVTRSKKMNRVYPRAFDHDKAKRLAREGWSTAALARKFGVSWQAIRRVIDPATQRAMQERTNQWHRDHRELCAGGCGALVWTIGSRPKSGYCRTCRGLRKAAEGARPAELYCGKCEQWKPDEAFTPGRGSPARRGRRSHCRACESATRRANRERERDRA